jgi:hypothetical protein
MVSPNLFYYILCSFLLLPFFGHELLPLVYASLGLALYPKIHVLVRLLLLPGAKCLCLFLDISLGHQHFLHERTRLDFHCFDVLLLGYLGFLVVILLPNVKVFHNLLLVKVDQLVFEFRPNHLFMMLSFFLPLVKVPVYVLRKHLVHNFCLELQV